MINLALKTFFLALLPSGSVMLQLTTGVPGGSVAGNEELELTLVEEGRVRFANDTVESAFLKGAGSDAMEKTGDLG